MGIVNRNFFFAEKKREEMPQSSAVEKSQPLAANPSIPS